MRDSATHGASVELAEHHETFEILDARPAPAVDNGPAAPEGVLSGLGAQQAVDADTLRSLFNYLVLQGAVPFQYSDDGCWARAHEMCRIAAGPPWSLVPRKIWLHDKLKVQTPMHPYRSSFSWYYHVALAVLQKGPAGDELMVLDPSLFGRPVTAQEWVEIQKPGAAAGDVEVLDAVVYFPSRRTPDRKDQFDHASFSLTNGHLARYLGKLSMRRACLAAFSRPAAQHCEVRSSVWGGNA